MLTSKDSTISSKKSASKKAATTKTKAVKSRKSAVLPEQRLHMIAEAAYFRAEGRNFQGGDTQKDWLEAEIEIDKTLKL